MGFVLLAALLITVGTWLLASCIHEHTQYYPPTCARCGYSLRGLQSNQCPECGGFLEPAVARTLSLVRRRLRLSWAMIVLGLVTVTIWRLQIVEGPSSSILPGAFKLIPRSGDYRQIVLSFVDANGRLSPAPQYAHLQVVAQNRAEEVVSLDAARAESVRSAADKTESSNPSMPISVRLFETLRSTAPEVSDSALLLDAVDVVKIIGNRVRSEDGWPSCQSSSRFICQQVVVLRNGSLRLTLGSIIVLLASGPVWYLGQLFIVRAVNARTKCS